MVQQSINLAKRPHVVVSFYFSGTAAFVIYVNLCVNIQKLTTYVLICYLFFPSRRLQHLDASWIIYRTQKDFLFAH